MKPKIFIGSSKEAKRIAEAIQYNLREEADCTPWHQGMFSLSHSTLHSLDSMTKFDFAVLVLTADDFVESKGKKDSAPRDNIVFELGLFMGKLGVDRTFMVYDKSVRPKIPSDLLGITYAEFEINSENDLLSAIGSPCFTIKETIRKMDCKPNIIVDLHQRINKLQKELSEMREEIPGKRLYQHRGYYPIEIEAVTNNPKLSRTIFIKAVKYFLKDTYDRLAVMDLIYLREDNFDAMGDILDEDDYSTYLSLIEKYELQAFVNNFESENKYIFQNLKKIVQDIGDTFKGCHMEILLHNVRNPMRSVVALKNTEGISNRKKYDPSTRFVVQFVKDQGRKFNQAINEGSKIGYPKQFNRTKQVKATTIPIQHARYGLVAMLCINIDKEKIESLSTQGRKVFINNYIKTTGETPVYELESWGMQNHKK